MSDQIPALYGSGAPTSRRGFRGFAPGQRNGCFERVQIQADPSWLYPQEVPIDHEQANPFAAAIAPSVILPHNLLEPGQSAAQVRPGAPLVAVWPQELGELPPGALPAIGGQVAQE